MRNRKSLLIIVFSIIVVVIGGYYVIKYFDNPIMNDELGMINAVEKAKSMDKDQFIHYTVSAPKKDSKELIAVVFNTDDEYNKGFIDEYGNVVKEPFLKNPYYDYQEKYRGSGVVDSFEGQYYIDRFSEKIFDRNFQEVYLTESQLEEYNIKMDLIYRDKEITEQKFKQIQKRLNRILKPGYETHIYNNSYNGEFYNISFVYDYRSYHIILDNNLHIATEFYIPDTTSLGLVSGPNKESKVGSFFVKDFGKVYYNLDGDIIWITYCKD